MKILDFRDFYLNLNLSRDYVCEYLGVNKSTIYRWESQNRAPLCAIRALERIEPGTSIKDLQGWEHWKVTEQGIISPRGHCYFLDEIEPPLLLTKGSIKGRQSRSSARFSRFGAPHARWLRAV
mgnify:CR=1 FL=1